MTQYLLNLTQIFGILFRVAKRIRVQKKIAKNYIEALINDSKKLNDGSLDDEDFRKITLYGNAVPAMLGEAYCVLRGNKISLKERLAMTYLAGMTGLFDDLFDRKDVSTEYIESLINNPIEQTHTNSNEKLLIKLYTNALKECNNTDYTKKCCIDVFKAQIESKKQTGNQICTKELEAITMQKGGASMLVYGCALNQTLSETEKQILYLLGGIGQLENDIFDVYKDFVDGIKTLATTETKISTIRGKYLSWANQIPLLVHQTNYSLPNKREFLLTTSLVISRGLVCLDQWDRNAKKTDGLFLIPSYTKKELTCDMEKVVNNVKLIHYAAIQMINA